MRTFTPHYVIDHVVVDVHCCQDVQLEAEEQVGACPVCKKKYSFSLDEYEHIKVREYRERGKHGMSEPNMRELLHQAIGTFYKYANNR